MQIKLKFSIDQVFAINKLLNEFYSTSTSAYSNYETLEKVQISICFKLSDTFETKARTLRKKVDLLNINKKVSITFWIYEAWALKDILFDNINLLGCNYDKLQAQKSIDLIDSKNI
ncbi:hypothetical protein SAMN04489761_4648 [Tenacibaculum sp. MAR_2009_124]|uniref:hypothetical protein n=1 Tax=Tenacibaculum sp. MAR_2009_124 TaxID=1250059 RepID=UPI000894ACDA|nr:hypothetical protein [Tenacibaculum sp. MAR_2009_124]SED21475.1 hypothetical protein SAMN04489761_4648 [Tenacibaculum sp. MAR_2009_124]